MLKPVALLILFVTPVVLLFIQLALFTEPRVGKALAKRLEEDTRSHRNSRHIYSLLIGSAAITHPLSWLMQPQHSHNIAVT